MTEVRRKKTRRKEWRGDGQRTKENRKKKENWGMGKNGNSVWRDWRSQSIAQPSRAPPAAHCSHLGKS